MGSSNSHCGEIFKHSGRIEERCCIGRCPKFGPLAVGWHHLLGVLRLVRHTSTRMGLVLWSRRCVDTGLARHLALSPSPRKANSGHGLQGAKCGLTPRSRADRLRRPLNANVRSHTRHGCLNDFGSSDRRPSAGLSHIRRVFNRTRQSFPRRKGIRRGTTWIYPFSGSRRCPYLSFGHRGREQEDDRDPNPWEQA